MKILLSTIGGLMLIACGLNTSARASVWVDMRVFGPFVCRANFPLAKYEGVFRHLADIQQDLTDRLGVPPARERIEILLFKNKATYSQYLKQWFPNIPFRRALYVKNKGPGMVFAYLSSDLETDIRHECTHALLHASLPMVPLWLDEGLAEYYEVPPNQRAGQNPHHGAVIWRLRFAQVPRLARLEAKREISEMGRTEYRDAWAWAHFLLNGPAPVRHELMSFLAEIRGGSAPRLLSQRLERAAGGSGEQLLVRHFKSFSRK
ncbi:MAG: hypothetical protein VB835_16805 [Pirellulales bacterium]